MSARVYGSGAFIIHTVTAAPAARVYGSGVYVIHTRSATVELTQTAAEAHPGYSDAVTSLLAGNLTLTQAESLASFLDAVNSQLFGSLFLTVGENANNWADAANLFTPTLHVTEDINNWADAISIVGLDYVLQVSDGIPALVDKINLLFALVLTATEDADNLSDNVATLLSGYSSLTPGETTNNFSDAFGMLLGIELNIQESWPSKLADNFALQLGINLPLAETYTPPTDAVSLNLISELTLNVSEDVDNLGDSVSTSTGTRGVGANRGSMTDYIRRYLNDVER